MSTLEGFKSVQGQDELCRRMNMTVSNIFKHLEKQNGVEYLKQIAEINGKISQKIIEEVPEELEESFTSQDNMDKQYTIPLKSKVVDKKMTNQGVLMKKKIRRKSVRKKVVVKKVKRVRIIGNVAVQPSNGERVIEVYRYEIEETKIGNLKNQRNRFMV